MIFVINNIHLSYWCTAWFSKTCFRTSSVNNLSQHK